jgi:hypothetical protein
MQNPFQINQPSLGKRCSRFFSSCKYSKLISSLKQSGYLANDGLHFTNEGKRIFFEDQGSLIHFRYVHYSNQGMEDYFSIQGSFFEQFLSFLDHFSEVVPRYESRSSIERTEESEVSLNLFSACLAKHLINEDIENGVIFVEQTEAFGRLIVRSGRVKPQKKNSQIFVSFLKGVGLIPWFFYSVARNGEEQGLVKEQIDQSIGQTTLLFYSFAYREGLLNRPTAETSFTSSELQVLEVAKILEVFKRDDVIFKSGMPKRTASYALSSLVRKGLLKRNGELGRRNSTYTLLSSSKTKK